jgi:4-hydroxy-tetrahydrodipicolinate synthase
MKNHVFSGLSVAVVTPFNPDFSIDKESYAKHLHFLLDNGVDHLVISGTTGESPSFTDEEFEYLVKTAVDIVAEKGKGSVIAGSGSNDTEKTIRKSILAEKCGANALLLVTPYYNKPMQRALIAHFTAIADSVTIPIMLYNVPGRTNVNMLPETTLALSAHPNIIAIKEASNDLQQIMKVIEIVPSDFGVFSGDDALTLPIIAAGGMGLVSVVGNEVPALTAAYVKACLAEDLDSARKLHYQLQPLMRFNFVETNPIPVKAALAMMGRMQNVLRLPLIPMDTKYEAELKGYLTDLGAL